VVSYARPLERMIRDAVILPGVTIGPGCVINTGAVVMRSMPANSAITGNPARIVGTVTTQ